MVFALTVRFGWPILVVYLLLVASSAVIEWKQSSHTAIESPPFTIIGQLALSLRTLGRSFLKEVRETLERIFIKNWGTWLAMTITLLFFLGAFLRDTLLTKRSQPEEGTASWESWQLPPLTRSATVITRDLACTKAGCKRISYHDLRHLFATRCVEARLCGLFRVSA